jgi:ribosomal protein S18 acetylase RimI-like enzyme
VLTCWIVIFADGWTVRSRRPDDLAAVDRLLSATANRVAAVDPRMRLPRQPETLSALVAVGPDGAVHGHVYPRQDELSEGEEMRAFAPDRSATWVEFAADDLAAAQALAQAVRAAGTAGAEADGVSWPTADSTARHWWTALGMAPIADFALRPPVPLDPRPAPGVKVRVAEPADEDAVVGLHLEQVAYHPAHSPHVRMVSGLEPAFRSRLAAQWAGRQPEAGGSVVYVVQRAGEVLGVAESWLHVVPDDGLGRMLAPGRYIYLNSVGIRADARGQGLGRTLVAGVLAGYAKEYPLTGSTLWYSVRNPIARQVWPRLGWRALWTQYDRRSQSGRR